MATTTLGKLADHIGAVLENGDPDYALSGMAGLEDAGPGDLTFLSNLKYEKYLAVSKAGAAVVGKNAGSAPIPLLRVDNPDLAFAKAAELLLPAPPMPQPGIHPTAVIASTAVVGKNVSIGPYVVVEDGAAIGDDTIVFPHCHIGIETTVGAGCILYHNVTLYHRVSIGSRCILHAGAVIGSDGFGFAWTGKGYYKIPQAGTVVIEDDVEIGANTTVDRARFGETRIMTGTKLDNQVQVAHNVRIGPMCVLAAQAGIAGSAKLGAGVQMGGQTGVNGHIRVGDGVIVATRSAVPKTWPGREADVSGKDLIVAGFIGMPMDEYTKQQHHIKSLEKMRKKFKEMEQRIAQLEGEKDGK
ncbi:MAG: UDP-3-O-(3-hydroxymyristoyl)glucosamine N-acyltransferase [Planctomycetes bacterium]|nr:UDP-3-O-(3-hydroxymyristoyl)glucosamine N-acyltransferase [Planctomycetota bacterium]